MCNNAWQDTREVVAGSRALGRAICKEPATGQVARDPATGQDDPSKPATGQAAGGQVVPGRAALGITTIEVWCESMTANAKLMCDSALHT